MCCWVHLNEVSDLKEILSVTFSKEQLEQKYQGEHDRTILVLWLGILCNLTKKKNVRCEFEPTVCLLKMLND